MNGSSHWNWERFSLEGTAARLRPWVLALRLAMKYFPFAHRQVCWGQGTDGTDTEMRRDSSEGRRILRTALGTETFVKRATTGNRNVTSESSGRGQTSPHSEGTPVPALR